MQLNSTDRSEGALTLPAFRWTALALLLRATGAALGLAKSHAHALEERALTKAAERGGTEAHVTSI